MADITVEILKSIRTDIADMRGDVSTLRTEVRADMARLDAKLDDTNREVHRLARAVEHNGERLGSMVSVLRLAVGREDDLDDRIRRLEAEVFG